MIFSRPQRAATPTPIEWEYELALGEVALRNFEQRDELDEDKMRIKRDPMFGKMSRNQLRTRMLQHLQIFLPAQQVFASCDHNSHENPNYSLPCGSAQSRAYSTGKVEFRATGKVYVCRICGKGHYCDSQCPFDNTCPWSGIARRTELLFMRDAVAPDDGHTYNMYYHQPFAGDGVDSRFSTILHRFLTQHLKKFPRILTEKERFDVTTKIRTVVMDLLHRKNEKVLKRRKQSNKRIRQQSPERNSIEQYLQLCGTRAWCPLLLRCVEEHLRTPEQLHDVHGEFILSVIDFITQLIIRILSTDLFPHFDVNKATLGILYVMSAETRIEMNNQVLIQHNARIAANIIPSNKLDTLYKRRYDKSQVIPGKTLVTNALRKLIGGQFSYTVEDFVIKPPPQ